MDRQLMARALELAARGIGQVSPGPLVGTVIVDESGEVVGEGFYLYDRVKHAQRRMSRLNRTHIMAARRLALKCLSKRESNASLPQSKILIHKFRDAALLICVKQASMFALG